MRADVTSSDRELDNTMTLSALVLGGMPERDFFDRYWRSRFLYVPGGGSHLLEMMPSLEEVEAVLGNDALDESEAFRYLSFPRDARPIFRTWVAAQTRPRRDLREPVNLVDTLRCFPKMRAFAEELDAHFSSGIHLQLFYGASHEGLLPHSDINDSFILQIVGRKRWRVRDVPPDEPLKRGDAGGELPPGSDSYELKPGDVLYKPSGGVHATESLEVPTLSLTASIVTYTAWEVLLGFLKDHYPSDPAWLERFPLGLDGLGDEALEARIASACEELSRGMPRLDELQSWWKARSREVPIRPLY
jgi:ribosomal protein L16 Arg81 hydroxylase